MGKILTLRLSQKMELAWLLAAMLGLLAMAAFYSSYLVPWTDEVQFTDPAFSLYFGQGFTSSAWPYQRPDEFFIGNAPLFSFLLYLWMLLAGTDTLVLHAINWLLASGATILVWLAWRRISPEIGSFVRVAILLTMLSGYGIAFGYFNLRYDTLGFFLFGLVFYASTLHGRMREAWLAVSGFLILLAGFHLAIATFLAITGFILLCRQPLRRWQSLILGMAAGGIFWLSLVAWHGLLKKFFVVTFGSQHVLTGQLGQLVLQGDKIGIGRFLHPVSIYVQDLSLLTMMACFLAGYFLLVRSKCQPILSADTWRMFVIAALLVPIGLYVIGKFPVYYTWIAYVPCCLLCGQVWQALIEKTGEKLALGLLVFCIVAISLGYVRNVVEIVQKDDPKIDRILAQVTPWLHKDDWVYSSFALYFISRPEVNRVFVSSYGHTGLVPGVPEKNRLSVVLVRQEEFEQTMQLLGGEWQIMQSFQVAESVASSGVLLLARRKTAAMGDHPELQ